MAIGCRATMWCAAALLGLTTWFVPGCAGHPRPRETQPERSDVTRTLRGYATFYGKGFAGRRTASGERYDPQQMVAAHRTLPFGTRVRVTNLENGRTVLLRVIDRGPYAGRNTIIDVSVAAARKLGFVEDGRTRVKVEVLAESDR